MLVLITDLDGTLLDANYSCEAAFPALDLLKRLHIPLVLCTSKTRAEVEAVRHQLSNRDPFIVENGGALYVPDGCLPFDLNTPTRRGAYAVIEFGDPYPELVQSLCRASEESGCTVQGFHQMTVEDVSTCCQMTPEAARLAKQREYDEPFKIVEGDPLRLLAAIEKEKKRWTRGDCFYHILGANDKAHCVNLLIHYYRTAFEHVTTAGLGDGPNDAEFLKLVDLPLVLESPASKELCCGPRANWRQPWGVNAAVADAVDRSPPGGRLRNGCSVKD
jgi:mannosyl-3-phosphoglycerate phosphatase